MSNMLDQAIIDASALKEAAVKSAEASLLEKYSSQIKEAVETILEQEDEMGEEDPLAGAEGAPEDAEMPELPMASMDNTEACACPDEDATQRIELDVDDLLRQVDAGGTEAPEMDRESTALEIAGTAPPLEESLELDASFLYDLAGTTPAEQSNKEIDKADFVDILEQLTVDISPESERPGWAGMSDSVIQLAEEELLALEQDSEVREKMDMMRKAVENLEKVKENLEAKVAALNESLGDSNKEKQTYINIIEGAKNKLVETNLTNARLLYTNQVLMNNSINERHKQKVVDALSESKTVEEAKIIFETLQSSAGSTDITPQSLSEAVNKTTSTLIMTRRNTERQEVRKDPAIDRWKILAGINNSFNTKEES
jgi:hypothetical protein